MLDSYIKVENLHLNYLGKTYLINFDGDAYFGENWEGKYGARKGTFSVNPEIPLSGLDYFIIPRLNRSFLAFLITFWNFQSSLNNKLYSNSGKQGEFYVSSVEFETLNHPDHWDMQLTLHGYYNNEKYRASIEYERPEDGPIKQNIIVTKT